MTTTEDNLLCFDRFTKEFKAKKLLDTVARCQEKLGWMKEILFLLLKSDNSTPLAFNFELLEDK